MLQRFRKNALEIRLILLAGSAIWLGGCASHYVIHSEPDGASVYINDKLVGQTPVEVSFSDLPQMPNLTLKLVKDGHGRFEGILPGPVMGELSKDIDITIPRVEDDAMRVNKMMSFVGQVGELTNQERYNEALKIIDSYIQENPKYVYPQILKASVLFLTKNYSASLALYQKVLEQEPGNPEALRMMQFIKAKGAQTK